MIERNRRRSTSPHQTVVAEVGGTLGFDLPRVGLGMASHGEALSERETDLITALRPSHLRADLHLATAGWRSMLDHGAETSRSTATGLELALFLGSDPKAELEALAAALPLAQARIVRVLVLQDGRPVVDPSVVRMAKGSLAARAPEAPFAGGTDGELAAFDRDPRAGDDLDAVAYSICASAHVEDGLSVMETASAHGDTVRSAQALCAGLPVVVSPVTIRPRDRRFGLRDGVSGSSNEVDPRQSSLFGAAWTLASFASLAQAGASSVTYFETTGWRGVMEQEGAAQPPAFTSRPGGVFPLYHVLADVREWEFGQVGESRSSAPLDLTVLCAHTLDGPRILLANLTPEPRRCRLGPLSAAQVAVRFLDESHVVSACDDPENFRGRYAKRRTRAGTLELELAPFAFVRVNA